MTNPTGDAHAAAQKHTEEVGHPDDYTLLGVLADIRHKTGVGDKPMLFELADAVVGSIKQGSSWQSIIDAPKDTWVIVYCDWVKQVALGRYSTTPASRGRKRTGWQVQFLSGFKVYIAGEPTLWMPLPQPPKPTDHALKAGSL